MIKLILLLKYNCKTKYKFIQVFSWDVKNIECSVDRFSIFFDTDYPTKFIFRSLSETIFRSFCRSNLSV